MAAEKFKNIVIMANRVAREFNGALDTCVLTSYALAAALTDLGYADARPGNPQFQPLSDEEVTSLVALLASWRDTSAAPEKQLSNK